MAVITECVWEGKEVSGPQMEREGGGGGGGGGGVGGVGGGEG